MNKLIFYLDPSAEGKNTKYMGELKRDGSFKGDPRLKKNLERSINFNNYDLQKDADWLELREKFSGTMMITVME